MCGIVGLFGSDCGFATDSKRNFMLDALYIDALRGKDSTGLAIIPKQKDIDPKIYKRAISGADFIELNAAKRLISSISSSFGAIGHNRSITRGWVDDESAHPFQYDHITLVHNGTVQNSDWLIGRKNESNSNVDSAQVAWCFSQEEPDTLLPKINGGFSLVWWDARDASLHFARNHERPMYWVNNPAGTMMYYASELGMLKMLTERHTIQIQSTALFTAPYVHYVFNDPTKLEVFEKRPFAEKKTKKIKKQHSYNDPWDSKVGSMNQTTKTSSTPTDIAQTSIFNVKENYTGEGLRPDGTKHIVETESLSKGIVDLVKSTNRAKWKMEEVQKKAKIAGFTPFRTIVVIPRQWHNYRDDTKIGHMLCTHSGSKAIVQIFDVTLGKWNEYCAAERLPVEVVNYRQSYDNDPDTVFTGYINIELYGKIKNNKGDKEVLITLEADKNPDELVEIGNRNPRYVTTSEYLKLTDKGCFECAKALAINSKIIWLGTDESCPLCEFCGTNATIVRQWENAAANPATH